MKILGHKLPDELYTLIKDKDRDELPFVSVASLRKLVPSDMVVTGGFFGGLKLFNIEAITRETLGTKSILDDAEMATIYAIGSSKRSKKAINDLRIYDIDKGLFIAGNLDEETIALDYRVDPNDPRILGFFESFRWVLLANSFAEFAEKVGL